MRLRALSLRNVRKFVGKEATISGISDGITVVSEANEFGKSTFFDALHALFFDKYSSSAKSVKSLQPYAKGAVEIAAEIETEAGLFRVEKSFLQKKSARILQLPDARVIAQDDAAERWIIEAMGSDKNGPAGLLWLRQGVVGLEADSKDESAKQLETRRDLLSSVSGEIDTMTGGRRMDRVMKRVGEALKELVTTTGKPTGAWRALHSDIAAMEEELARLNAQIEKHSLALAGRKQAEAQLAHLDQAEAKAKRAEDLVQAEAAFARARDHAGRIEAAEQQHRLAEIEAQGRRRQLDAFLAAVQTLAVAQTEANAAQSAAAEAVANCKVLNDALSRAQEARATTQAAIAAARTTFEVARKQAEARAARSRSDDLNKRLQQIEKVQKSRDEAQAFVTTSTVTADALRKIEDAENAVIAQTAALSAQAVTLRLSYSGSARVTQGGEVLPEAAPVALTASADLSLEGIGTMSVEVPETDTAATLARARDHRDAALASAGVTSLAQARESAVRRAKAVQEVETARTILATLAPEGTDQLRAQKATADLAASEAHDDPLPDPATMEAALAQAQHDDATSQANLAEAEARHSRAREAMIRAQSNAQNTTQTLEKAITDAGDPKTQDAQKTELIRADAQAAQALANAEETLATLRRDAPDMATAQAELTRAKAAVTAAEEQSQTLRVRIAALSAEIHAQSEVGVEEARDTLAGQLDTARATEARYASKAAALTRLQAALEAERTAARDMYFGPVQAELAPLLAILYDEAGLQFDTDSLLPKGLTRARTEEDFESLSGGTQEQIAILTRLAFARLFKGQGRHIPIVLDDALVYSDDARIVKMFTALTRVAQDQQILVFTCRTMAFLGLGGTRPEVTIRDL